MERSNRLYKSIDWTIVVIYLLLVVFGWLNIYAAVYNDKHKSIIDFTQRYGKQLLWIAISIVLIIIIFIVDARIYEFISYPSYLLSIVLLIAVLVIGKTVKNSVSWFEIGGFRFQPGEFAKLATALAVSKLMSLYDFKIDRFGDLLKVAGILFLPAALIILQNDTGSAMVFSAFIIVLYREGLAPWYLIIFFLFIVLFFITLIADLFIVFICLPALALLVFHLIYRSTKLTFFGILFYSISVFLLIANKYFLHYDKEKLIVIGIMSSTIILGYIAYIKRVKYVIHIAIILIGAIIFTFSVDYIFDHVLEKHQRTRINVVLGLESDPQGVEYNVNQSKIAIGSGEFTGKGFLQGTQTKFNFVPEQDTDFIFCTVGEEWGFLGTSFVILMFGVLLVRIVRIAERQRSRFNRIYAYCVASILFFHITINMGMTIGLMPVVGIPLPFFSYGGSSLWMFTILLFILLKLDSARLDKF